MVFKLWGKNLWGAITDQGRRALYVYDIELQLTLLVICSVFCCLVCCFVPKIIIRKETDYGTYNVSYCYPRSWCMISIYWQSRPKLCKLPCSHRIFNMIYSIWYANDLKVNVCPLTILLNPRYCIFNEGEADWWIWWINNIMNTFRIKKLKEKWKTMGNTWPGPNHGCQANMETKPTINLFAHFIYHFLFCPQRGVCFHNYRYTIWYLVHFKK